MIMTKAMKEAIDNAYARGYAAGQADKAVEAFNDEARRNEQLYTWAYNQGAMDAMAKHGIIEIDDLVKELEEAGATIEFKEK